MRTHRLTAVLLAAAFAVLVLGASATAAVKNGTYTGQTSPTGNKITLKVKKHKKVKVNYCDYSFGGKVKSSGKFKAAYNGPGGTYEAVKGKFSGSSVDGTVTVDYLCPTDTTGEEFTAHK
jgi:hypothetical protein